MKGRGEAFRVGKQDSVCNHNPQTRVLLRSARGDFRLLGWIYVEVNAGSSRANILKSPFAVPFPTDLRRDLESWPTM